MLDDVFRRRLTLEADGVEISLLDWGGDGPLAVLHHANGFCAALWAPVAEALRSHFRVIAMDARGHGDSSAPEGADAYRWELFGRDLAAVARTLADEHGGGRVALGLGHSFGGTSMLMASAERPGLFERIVAVDPVAHPPPVAEVDPRRRERVSTLADGARRRRHVFANREEARASWAGKSFFAGWDPRALDLYVAEGLRERPDGQVELKCDGEVEAAVFDNGRFFDLWALVEKVETPALFQWATRGDFPRAAYEALTSRMPDARVIDVDAGHLVPMERPELVVAAVESFCGIRG